MIDDFARDTRYGFRLLVKNPGLASIVVITLALSIGASSAIFSVVNAVLLRPLNYSAPNRLVTLQSFRRGKLGQVSPANFLDWRGQSDSFQDIAAFHIGGANLMAGGDVERVQLAITSASFFRVFGISPSVGRDFTPDDEAAGHSPVAMISNRLWQRNFGSSGDIAGKSIVIDGRLHSVIGVVPASFDYPRGTDVWLSPRRIVPELGQDIGDETTVRGLGYLGVIARLSPDTSVEQAQSEMDGINARLVAQYPDANADLSIKVRPLSESLVGAVRSMLLLLFGSVGLLLLIACANVANLMLARATGRQREIAIRAALGASRARIMRQLLAEGLVPALLGGTAGLVLGRWGIDWLIGLNPDAIPRSNEIGLDIRVLLFTAGVSCAVGLLFGLAPALQVSRPDSSQTMKEGARGGTGGNRLRSTLVVCEVALSMALLIGAGLMFRSFINLQQLRPGFESSHVLTFRIAPSGASYQTDDQQRDFFSRLLAGLAGVPGVQAVGAIDTLPLAGGPHYGYFIESRPPYTPATRLAANFRIVSPEYFRAMGIQLIEGRLPNQQDNGTAPGILVINQALARRDFPDQDPIGQRLGFGSRNGQPDWLEIVGVVGDVRNDELQREPSPEAYRSYLQRPSSEMSVALRSTSNEESIVGALKEQVREIDTTQPVAEIRMMDRVLYGATSQPRFNLMLLACFAIVALILATSGIYGVMSYTVTHRTHEIGVRVALGASHCRVLLLVVGKGLGLALIGIAIGVGGSLAITRLMSGLLFGVSSTDPATFGIVAVIFVAVAAVASYIPARRASRIDPAIALRYE
jgi:putative ABC transport system permease protein